MNGNHFVVQNIFKTRYVWVYCLQRKDKVFEKFCEQQVMVERSTDQKLKVIHTDNRGEFISTEFEAHLRIEGVKQ